MGCKWPYCCGFVGYYNQDLFKTECSILVLSHLTLSPGVLLESKWYNYIIVLTRLQKKKRTCRIVDFAVPSEHRVKLKESKKRDIYLDLGRGLKKTTEHEGDGDTDRYLTTNGVTSWKHTTILARRPFQ